MADKNQLLEEANQALQRMQTFDVETLPRVVELGQDINFQSAVDPAKRLVDLYKRLAANSLDDLSQTALQQLKDRANNDFSLFKQALDFKLATQSNPQSTRDSIVGQIASSYDQSFQILHPYIAYSLHRSADFQRLDSDARSTPTSERRQTSMNPRPKCGGKERPNSQSVLAYTQQSVCSCIKFHTLCRLQHTKPFNSPSVKCLSFR